VKNLQASLSEESKRGERVVAAEKDARKAGNDVNHTKALLAEEKRKVGKLQEQLNQLREEHKVDKLYR